MLLDQVHRHVPLPAIAYGVAGVPETFFIDKTGTIVRKVSGPVSQEIMVTTLEEIL